MASCILVSHLNLCIITIIYRDQPIMLIIYLLCYAAVLKKSTYYACISAQCLPIMLNIVLHLLLFCFRFPHYGQKMIEWLEHYLFSCFSQKRLIYFNKTTSRMTVLLECYIILCIYAKNHFASRNLFHYAVILPNMLAWCSMLSGTHYA